MLTNPRITSWAGLCPGNNESAGKRKTGKTRKGNRGLKPLLVGVRLGGRPRSAHLSRCAVRAPGPAPRQEESTDRRRPYHPRNGGRHRFGALMGDAQVAAAIGMAPYDLRRAD